MSTTSKKTTKPRSPRGRRCSFRYRAVTPKAGAGNWSAPAWSPPFRRRPSGAAGGAGMGG
jgi:hypothetical protein